MFVRYRHPDMQGWFYADFPLHTLDEAARALFGVEENRATWLVEECECPPQDWLAEHVERLRSTAEAYRLRADKYEKLLDTSEQEE